MSTEVTLDPWIEKPAAILRIILPYLDMLGMVFCLKTTRNIDDAVASELKREAAPQGRTMSEMIETAPTFPMKVRAASGARVFEAAAHSSTLVTAARCIRKGDSDRGQYPRVRVRGRR